MKTPQQIEEDLQNLIDAYKLSQKLTVGMIKDWILNDEGESKMDAVNRFQKKWIRYFSKVKDTDELNKILQVFVDAWNYFPHKSLKDKSPKQIVVEELKKHPELKKTVRKKMPDMIVGGQRMKWDDYWAMIKEMERQQIPFKNWIENEVMPKYEKFLFQTLSKRVAEKHREVADIFFERVLHVGFLDFHRIRKDFIQKEFPHWWQTHVLMSSLSEKEVLSSLKKFFQFIAAVFDENIKKFGF